MSTGKDRCDSDVPDGNGEREKRAQRSREEGLVDPPRPGYYDERVRRRRLHALIHG